MFCKITSAQKEELAHETWNILRNACLDLCCLYFGSTNDVTKRQLVYLSVSSVHSGSSRWRVTLSPAASCSWDPGISGSEAWSRAPETSGRSLSVLHPFARASCVTLTSPVCSVDSSGQRHRPAGPFRSGPAPGRWPRSLQHFCVRWHQRSLCGGEMQIIYKYGYSKRNNYNLSHCRHVLSLLTKWPWHFLYYILYNASKDKTCFSVSSLQCGLGSCCAQTM